MSLYCDDPDEEWAFEPVRLIRPEDRLNPAPPRNWVRVCALPPATERHSLDVGVWVILTSNAQMRSEQDGIRRHFFARDGNGATVLLVHPELGDVFSALVDDMDQAHRSCHCGGSECIEGNLQSRWIFSKTWRFWKSISIADRICLLQKYDGSVDTSDLQRYAEDPEFLPSGDASDFVDFLNDYPSLGEILTCTDSE